MFSLIMSVMWVWGRCRGEYENGIVELEAWENFAENRDDPDEWSSGRFDKFNQWRLRHNPPNIQVRVSPSIRQRKRTTLSVSPVKTRTNTILCPQIKNGILAF